MGCEESRTIEDIKKQEKGAIAVGNPNSPNLAQKMVRGHLEPFGDKKFEDCIIKNEEEFENKIIDFIPTKIPDPNDDNKEIPNVSDDIVTQSLKVDFSLNDIIALSGFNEILKVENNNGNYLIYHDGKKGNKKTYIAIVVEKIITDFPNLQFNPIKSW